MPKLINRSAQDRRFGLSLTQELYSKVVILAGIEGTLPAIFARNVLEQYVEAHADEIAEAQRAADAYQKSLDEIRSRRQTPAEG